MMSGFAGVPRGARERTRPNRRSIAASRNNSGALAGHDAPSARGAVSVWNRKQRDGLSEDERYLQHMAPARALGASAASPPQPPPPPSSSSKMKPFSAFARHEQRAANMSPAGTSRLARRRESHHRQKLSSEAARTEALRQHFSERFPSKTAAPALAPAAVPAHALDSQMQSYADTGKNTNALIRRLQLAELKAAKHEVDTETLKVELEKAMQLAERAVQESETLRAEHAEEKTWWVQQSDKMRAQMQDLVELRSLERKRGPEAGSGIGSDTIIGSGDSNGSASKNSNSSLNAELKMEDWVGMCAHTISRAAGVCSAVRALQGDMMSGIRCAANGGHDRTAVTSDLFRLTEGSLSNRLGATMVVFDATVAAMTSYVKQVKKVAIDATQSQTQLKQELSRLRESIDAGRRGHASPTLHRSDTTSSLRAARAALEAHRSSETPPQSPEPSDHVPVPSPSASGRQQQASPPRPLPPPQQQQQQQQQHEVHHHHHHHHHHTSQPAGSASTPFKEYPIPPTPANTPAQLPQTQSHEGVQAAESLAPLSPGKIQSNKGMSAHQAAYLLKSPEAPSSYPTRLPSSSGHTQEITTAASQVIEAQTSKVALELDRRFELAFGNAAADGSASGEDPDPAPIITTMAVPDPARAAAEIKHPTPPIPWTVPRRASGEFDDTKATQRLLEILDKDKNGKIDAREIVDALHSHQNKEEIISLLRLHPDPEKALGIASADADGEVAVGTPVTADGERSGSGSHPSHLKITSLKLELEHAKSTLAAVTDRVSDGDKKKKKARRRLSVADQNALLMAALDRDRNGHVDAHELITMIREHPEADQLIEMVSKIPDPKFVLGIVKAPSKYRRRSTLVRELNEAKKHLHHTRKRVSTLQTNKQDAQALRAQLVEFKRQHEQAERDRHELKMRRSGLGSKLAAAEDLEGAGGEEEEEEEEEELEQEQEQEQRGQYFKDATPVKRSPPRQLSAREPAAAVVQDLNRHTAVELQFPSLSSNSAAIRLKSPTVSPENKLNYDRMRRRMVSELVRESPKSRRGPRVRGYEGKAILGRAERFLSYGAEMEHQSSRRGRKASSAFNSSSVKLG